MSGCQHLPSTQNDRVIGNAKMRVQSLGWARVTKSGHAYEMRAVLDIAFPAKSPRRFNRDTRRGSEDILAPRLALLLEELPAGHRNDGGVDLMVVPQRIGKAWIR